MATHSYSDQAATTSLFNDLIGSTYRSLNFNANAPAYVINGNPIHLGYLMTGIGITPPETSSATRSRIKP